MASEQYTNEHSKEASRPRFDVAMFITKNLHKLNDDEVARLAASRKYQRKRSKFLMERERLTTVLQEKSSNPQKRKAEDQLGKTKKH